MCSRHVFLTAFPWKALVFLILLYGGEAQATGFRILGQSASGVGQANAVVAQADDASAVYYNPAGMTQLPGIHMAFGSTLIGGGTDFTSTTGATTHGNFGGSIAVPPPSHVYATADLKYLGIEFLGDTTVGLAVVSPFGIKYEYPTSAPFATAFTRTTLELTDIKPTIAFRLNDFLSFGLGADIYTFFSFLGEGQAEISLVSSGGPGLPPAGARLEFNGTDTAAGFNVSLLYTPLRNAAGKALANVGLVYRSQATLQLEGQFLANGALIADASASLVLPQVVTGGIALWPVRDQDHEWKMEADIDYTGWKSFRNFDIRLSSGPTIFFPQNWRNTFTILIGTEYKWLQPSLFTAWEAALRGGYWFSQSAPPDRTFNPTIPDADNHAISIGLGLLCKGQGKFLGLVPCGQGGNNLIWPTSIRLDLAYMANIFEKRTVNGAVHPLAIPGVIDGTYETIFHVGTLSLGMTF